MVIRPQSGCGIGHSAAVLSLQQDLGLHLGGIVEGYCSGHQLIRWPLFSFPSSRACISLMCTWHPAVSQLLLTQRKKIESSDSAPSEPPCIPTNRTRELSSLECKTQWQIREPAYPLVTHSSKTQSHCQGRRNIES